MFCCSPVSDQEEEKDEPDPPRPFEWTEFCCSPIVAMPGQEEERDEPEPPQPFEWTEDWVATAFPTCAGSIEIECICFNYYTFVVITHKFCSVLYFSLLLFKCCTQLSMCTVGYGMCCSHPLSDWTELSIVIMTLQLLFILLTWQL